MIKATFTVFAAASLLPWDAPAAATSLEARQVFETYMKCAVQKHPKDAIAVVLSTGTTEDVFKAHRGLITPDCLNSGQLKIPDADFVRYGLAEALVRREYARGLPPDIAHAAPLTHFEVDEAKFQPKPGHKPNPKELAKLQDDRQKAVATQALSFYGECIARADPAGALRLVMTAPASKEENQAFAALMQPLAQCLPEGTTIKLDKASLRGTVAMNLYRLAKAPRIPTTGAATPR